MTQGGRITDEVEFFRRRGQLQHAVRAVRTRAPERLRWRVAVAGLTQSAGALRGRSRMRIEEPIREVVLDLPDRMLRRETVLDARRHGVDLDRGEILPCVTRWDLRRSSFLIGVDHLAFVPHMRLPDEYSAPIDTAAAVLLSRAFAVAHKSRAERLQETCDALPSEAQVTRQQQQRLQYVERDKDLARRWMALAKVLVEDSR